MAVGFRILEAPPPPPPGLVAALRVCATAHLADSMSRLQAASGALLPRHRGALTLCGPALTVRAAPGDNLMAQKAIDMARPGDVILIDVGGFTEQAVLGEIMVSHAITRGVGGFVVDGAIRDVGFIAAGQLPVYARGVTPRGPSRVGPGEIHVPISVGGMVVQPGDIVVGDADGVVAVPLSDAATVLAAAQGLRAREEGLLEKVRIGAADRGWIDTALHANGCSGF